MRVAVGPTTEKAQEMIMRFAVLPSATHQDYADWRVGDVAVTSAGRVN